MLRNRTKIGFTDAAVNFPHTAASILTDPPKWSAWGALKQGLFYSTNFSKIGWVCIRYRYGGPCHMRGRLRAKKL